MKFTVEYEYTNKRQIWRLIPTDTEKLIIEDRDIGTKEVFFNCIDINNGEEIIENFQLDEKHWIGIESVYRDIIYFHKFEKPDMPGHRGIIAFDISSQDIIWSTENYIFLFILNEKLYCYNNTFDGRNYYILDYRTGELLDELGDNSLIINELREKAFNSSGYENYLFPSPFNSEDIEDPLIGKYLVEIKSKYNTTGGIEYIKMGDALLLNYHEVLPGGILCNKFTAIDIFSEKVIFKDVLNYNTKLLIPDSFFVKDKLIFLLKEKEKLTVCSLTY